MFLIAFKKSRPSTTPATPSKSWHELLSPATVWRNSIKFFLQQHLWRPCRNMSGWTNPQMVMMRVNVFVSSLS